MRNEHPASCSLCKTNVESYEGVLSKVEGRWVVTHADSCPVEALRTAHVNSLIQCDVKILSQESSEKPHILAALASLGKLIRCGLVDEEKCVQMVMESTAVQKLHRLDLEQLMQDYLLDSVSR